jgi:hypothetical protein
LHQEACEAYSESLPITRTLYAREPRKFTDKLVNRLAGLSKCLIACHRETEAVAIDVEIATLEGP